MCCRKMSCHNICCHNIRRGDVVLGLNNSETQSVVQFNKQINAVRKGKTVAVLVQRGDSTLYVPIKVTK